MKANVLSERDLFTGFISLRQVELQFEKFDGTLSEPVQRLVVHRGDAVAVLVYDSTARTVILVRQFRYPVYSVDPEQGWHLEIVAGVIDSGETPASTAVREVEEETGYVIKNGDLIPLGKIYPSPGAFSERIYLFAADIRMAKRNHAGGGLPHEHEDIQVEVKSWEEIRRMVTDHQIEDGKSLITMQWLLSQPAA